jgi:catechol 2,3-dioxygenase-like lactoylglutathione lyase family enzyme
VVAIAIACLRLRPDGTVRRVEVTTMSVRFNHTIVHSRDQARSAAFLAEILGLPAPRTFGHFAVVDLDHDVSLDFIDVGEGNEIVTQHYAFLVDEAEFDPIFERIRARGLDYWADPFKQKAGEINRHDGGRGVYFSDPDAHLLEIITRPYGSGDASA